MTAISSAKQPVNLLDSLEWIAILLLFAWLCARFYVGLADAPFNLIFLISEGAVALFVLLRRATQQISVRPIDWGVGIVGTMLPMLVNPSGTGWLGGAILLIAGLSISLGAKFSLRRSFGVVPANRGIKSNGLYATVRHPMYLGYFLTYTGFLILNPSIYNFGLMTLWAFCQVARIKAEERILLQDPEYQAHSRKVRFRLLPHVY